MNATVVRVAEGLLRGECSTTDGVCFFGQIPFATPPTGALRWRPPEAPRAWTGIRDATNFGPLCMQVLNVEPEGAEDCLHLNVWVPPSCWSATNCATMMWIHGGGYNIGSGINYDGTRDAALARDVIVVTTNYRLSVLGFAAIPGARGESSGNFGLLDQRAAMVWMKANAKAFGGSGRLTLAGESAGASSITCHLCMRSSAPLFEAAAMESGAFVHWASRPWTVAATQYGTLLHVTGCSDAACLRRLDASNLTAVASNVSLGFGGLSGKRYAPSWAPTVDGVELLALPSELLAAGRCAFAPKPLLLGVNRDEGTSSVGSPDEPLLEKGYNMSEADLRAYISSWLRGDKARLAEALRLYAVGSSPFYSRPYWAATHFAGDLLSRARRFAPRATTAACRPRRRFCTSSTTSRATRHSMRVRAASQTRRA